MPECNLEDIKKYDILVSISCITYNHENYIAEAIDSFLMQKTTFNYEILIYDDASTDRTADIIREYENSYPDIIKVIYQKENQYSKGITRIGYTYNDSRAQGKYIALCEGDDYWIDPNKLQKQIEYLESNPKCAMCVHASRRVSINGKEVQPLLGLSGNNNQILRLEDIGYRFFATASRVYRKELLKDTPPWFYQTDSGDMASYLLLMSRGYCYYMREVMCAYRVGVPGSSNERLKQKNIEEKKRHYSERIEVFNSFNLFTGYRYKSVIDRNILDLITVRIAIEPNFYKRKREWKSNNIQRIFPDMKSLYIYKRKLHAFFPGLYIFMSSVYQKFK